MRLIPPLKPNEPETSVAKVHSRLLATAMAEALAELQRRDTTSVDRAVEILSRARRTHLDRLHEGTV